LAEANGVFSGRNAIELFEFGLLNALFTVSGIGKLFSPYLSWKVNFHGLDADVHWARLHGELLRQVRQILVSEGFKALASDTESDFKKGRQQGGA
jgi:hypothetical protein